MEKIPTTSQSKNEQLLEERVVEIIDNFNWDLFYEILSRHQRKSGYKKTQQDEINFRKGIDKIVKMNGDENFVELFSNHSPTFEFNNSIGAIADASTFFSQNGRIRINLNHLEEAIRVSSLEFRARNIKLDFDFVELYVIKIIIHELMHLYGEIQNQFKSKTYSSINETITELLSFRIMIEYMNSVGKRMNENIETAFYTGAYTIYEPEKQIFTNFVLFFLNSENQTIRSIVDAFYWAYLNFYNVSSDEFLDLLPEEIQDIWIKFLDLNQETDDYSTNVENLLKSLREIRGV